MPRLLLVTRPLASFVRAAGEVTEAEVRGEAEVLPVASLFLPTLVMLPTTPLLALFTAFWCCKGCRSVRQPLRGLECPKNNFGFRFEIFTCCLCSSDCPCSPAKAWEVHHRSLFQRKIPHFARSPRPRGPRQDQGWRAWVPGAAPGSSVGEEW